MKGPNLHRVPQLFYMFFTLAVITAGLVVIFRITMKDFDQLKDRSYSFLEDAYEIELAQLRKNPAGLTPGEIKILENKVLVLEKYKLHHIVIVEKLFRSRYATYTLFPLLSAISAVLTFFLIQRGWSSSNLFLKVFFVYFAALTALSGIYPEVYQQNKNIQSNLETYRALDKLQKTVFNYAVSAPVSDGVELPFQGFVDKVNIEEKKLLNPLDFAIEQRSAENEILENLNQ